MFFCVKQKTAYVQVFRYWSSDVCSSDLTYQDRRAATPAQHAQRARCVAPISGDDDTDGHEQDRAELDQQELLLRIAERRRPMREREARREIEDRETGDDGKRDRKSVE